MIRKKQTAKYILNNKNERRMKCTIIEDDERVLISSGSTTSRSGNFMNHFDIQAKSVKQAWFIWHNIKKVSDVSKFIELCK